MSSSLGLRLAGPLVLLVLCLLVQAGLGRLLVAQEPLNALFSARLWPLFVTAMLLAVRAICFFAAPAWLVYAIAQYLLEKRA